MFGGTNKLGDDKKSYLLSLNILYQSITSIKKPESGFWSVKRGGT
jgi:hypothetical protein